MPTIKQFKGLCNTTDPMRSVLGWLTTADNINITDSGAIAQRKGYSQVSAGSYTGAFSTFDFSRMYVVVGGVIKDFVGNTICTLTSSAPMYWAEINDQVFFNNGADSGIILPDNSVLPWRWANSPAPSVAAVTGSLAPGKYQVRCTYILADGRETGSSDAGEIDLDGAQALQIGVPQSSGCSTNVYIAPPGSSVYQLYCNTTRTVLVWNDSADNLGRDLLNAFFDPLPLGADVVQVWGGRAYAAQYMPSDDQTAIWYSEPLAFHLWNLNANFILVPGRVLMLAPHDDALIVGTDSRVYAYDDGAPLGVGTTPHYRTNKLDQLAEYGVVPGIHWSKDVDRILFWTNRGLCSALPFKNLTEHQVSVAPGVRAGGCVVRTGGQRRYIAAVQTGGSVFNAYP